jgi:hypothetical protein
MTSFATSPAFGPAPDAGALAGVSKRVAAHARGSGLARRHRGAS